MIEELSKLLLILFLCNICFLQDTVNQSKAVNLNIVPYQENNTILGFNISDDKNCRLSVLLQNWFTNNLYLQGILSPSKKSNNLFSHDDSLKKKDSSSTHSTEEPEKVEIFLPSFSMISSEL